MSHKRIASWRLEELRQAEEDQMISGDNQRLKNLVHGDHDTDPIAGHPGLGARASYPRAPEPRPLKAAVDVLDPLRPDEYDARVKAARKASVPAVEPRTVADMGDPLDPSSYDRRVRALRVANAAAARGVNDAD